LKDISSGLKKRGPPMSTCFTISSPKAYQNPTNLVVVEKDIVIEIYSVCNVSKPILNAEHKGYSKVILKENSTLKMKHFHYWEKRLCPIEHRIYS
jgi:hypothetical protein